MAYSEGFALTFLAFGLVALLRRRWLLAGLLGLLASATTPVALGFEVSCLWCAYRELVPDRNWRSLAAPILAPLGFVGYQLWLWQHTGHLNAWRLTERGGWKSYPSLVYAVHTVVVFVKDPIATNQTDDLLFVCTAVVVFASVVAIRSSMPRPVVLYGLAAAGPGHDLGADRAAAALHLPGLSADHRRGHLATPTGLRLAVWVSAVLLAAMTAFEVSSYRIFP